MQKSWFVMECKYPEIKIDGKTDIRYPEIFVKKMLLEFTKKGDKVFDPFSGFGTTLITAQKLKRVGIGIEYDLKRFEYARKKLKFPNKVIHGNALKINEYNLPKFDFCLTSPPYMRNFDSEDPFSNYTKKGSYSKYLKDIKQIFSQVKKVMKKNALIIVEISNTFGKRKPMTPLAWDVGKEISKVLYLEQEIIYCAKNVNSASKGQNHSYCLIFRNK
ncbi:MAG TPA: DNA methyltransferase [Candidatus Nanoarchaeia archaeon]|nr:DNA methyltransferase [Candidatus Nanoarchaeia archaeon]